MNKNTTKKNKRGQKPKYQTAEEFSKSIDTYFFTLDSTKPATITGLSLHLGFHSRDWVQDYAKKGQEYADAIARAKMQIEENWIPRLLDKFGSKGAEFYLRCNCGYMTATERKDAELKEKQAAKEALEDKELSINVSFEDCSK